MTCDCGEPCEEGGDTCFRCRVASVGLSLKAPATRGDFHRTANDWRLENFGTTSERELAARGIERAPR